MSATKPVGRYQILGELGRGATGVVYRAQDPAIGRAVAIKTIPLTSSTPEEREEQLGRLRREAQLAGRLSHPSVVTVYDFVENTESAYVCMELVEGDSLSNLMEVRRRFTQGQVLSILRQAAEALDYAHQAGVVHRDVKPGNILIGPNTEVKITDFGVAKAVSEEATATAASPGTPAYMSPEQVHSRPAGGRSDQFSLGVVAYEMLTGERPFSGDSVASIAYKVSHEAAVPPSVLNPTLGPAVDMIFARVLSKDPTMRYASAGDFVADLGRGLAATPGWEPKVRGECLAAATASSTNLLGIPRRKKSGTSFYPSMLAVAALLGVAGLFWFLSSARRPGVPIDVQVPEVRPAPTQITPLPPAPPPIAQEPQADNTPTETSSAPISSGVATSRRYTYDVAIDSMPGNATVYLDNLPLRLCVTPCRVALTVGQHALKFEREGHRPRIMDLEVPSLSSVFVELEAREGSVLVKSDPPGATVIVDGKPWASLTPTTVTLPVGAHTIIVRKDGVPDEQRDVTVRDGALATLEVTWK